MAAHHVPGSDGAPNSAGRQLDAAASGTVLLLVEDDQTIAEPLTEGLENAGFTVRHVRTGRAALADHRADLILLDLGLPDLDGGEVCRQLRRLSETPIIVITARGDEVDRVILLELGADDYLVKPFGFRELVARIRAVLRRAHDGSPAQPALASLGALSLDRRGRRAYLAGRELELTSKEFDLLAFLAEEPDAVRRRDEIIAAVWDEHWWGSTKTLDVHIASLRKKLGDPRWISTLRGVGYRLNEPR